MKRISGYHLDIKFLLEPVKSSIKSIKTNRAGYEDETITVTFYSGSQWILGHKKFPGIGWEIVEEHEPIAACTFNATYSFNKKEKMPDFSCKSSLYYNEKLVPMEL